MKHVTDCIGEEYKTWENEIIAIEAGTGRGKTYFIINVLLPYAKSHGKRMLYLCNRKELQRQIEETIPQDCKPFSKVITYQLLESALQGKGTYEHYDYVVADEAHYLFDDSYNQQTDISGKYLVNIVPHNSTLILMSATGDLLFSALHRFKKIKPNRHYKIQGYYDFVEHVYLYEKKYAEDLIDKILNQSEAKVLFFCDSLHRLGEMYKIYRDKAYYRCSNKSQKSSIIPLNVLKEGDRCIIDSENGCKTFDRRILFTTTVIDNGVDIKDLNLRYVFSEVFDFNTLIQSLGRKRCLGSNDRCTYYIANHVNAEISRKYREANEQLEMIELYENDYPNFKRLVDKDRSFFKNYPVFYIGADTKKPGELTPININSMQRYKIQSIKDDCKEMLAKGGYSQKLQALIKEVMQKDLEEIDCHKQMQKYFSEFLQKNTNVEMYRDSAQYKKLKHGFEKMKCKKTSSLRSINEYLFEQKMPYKIESHVCRERGEHRDKTYWLIKHSEP